MMELLLDRITDLKIGLAIENGWQLCHDVVEGHVPGLPHGVLVGCRESRVGLRGAVVRVHDPLS